jgi:hypothetical protein
MQPSQIAETSKLLFPSLRFCIVSPFEPFSHPEIRIKRRASGSPILPIYCLFLSLCDKSLVYPKPKTILGIGQTNFYSENNSKNATPPPDQVRALRTELASRIASFVGSKEKLITDIPSLLLSRASP